jgi:hypothetical protein
MKEIKGYEGLYSITSCGKVWSHRRGVFLEPIYDKYGYLKVNLYKDDKLKTFLVHRLVAIAYIPNPDNLPEVNHKDEIKDHDWINNLEWCTHGYNINYGTRTERQIQSRMGKHYEKAGMQLYCPELDMYFKSQTEASQQTGARQEEISKCLKGKKKHAGRHPWTGELLSWHKVS